MFSLISEAPPSVTPEQHAELTASTPASFTDIPPVLKFEGDVEVELDPSLDGLKAGSRANGHSAGATQHLDGKLWATEA